MKMDFTLKSVLALVLVAVPAAYGMELYVGACVTGDFAAILENLGFFSVIVGTLVLASALVLRLALRPLARADAALARGAALPLPEREAALGVVLRVQTLVIATMLLGFLVGPAVMMGVQTALGKGHYGDGLWARLLAVNFSIGLMAGTQIVVLVDGILREPLARLGARRFPKGRRPVSVRGRILLAGLASTLLCGVLTAAAGNLAPAGPGVGVLLLLCLLWSFLLCSSVGSTLAGRISLLGGRVDALASGGGDLSERLPLLREDEIGKLSGSLNAFLDELASILGSVRGLSRRVSEGSESLAETSGHAGASLEGLESSLAAVRQAAERQSETVGGAEGEIARMLESVETVAARVGEQASAVEQSSAAVSEMAANVASVSRTAGRADELARKLTEASAEGGGAIKASLEAIGEIEAASKAVRDIVGVISKIAAQTNLLAMNAAIEAAHAGEAGTGFAVVADEVRGLAESAARSAKEIVGLIKEMGQKIDRGSSLADRAGAAFERIDQGVAETGELVRTIAASMSEQRQGAEEILGSVNALTDATQRIKDLTLEQREQSSAIGDAIRRIVGASNEIFEAVQEQTGGTQALGRAVQAVAGEAARNREAVRGLDALVSKFRLTEES